MTEITLSNLLFSNKLLFNIYDYIIEEMHNRLIRRKQIRRIRISIKACFHKFNTTIDTLRDRFFINKVWSLSHSTKSDPSPVSVPQKNEYAYFGTR